MELTVSETHLTLILRGPLGAVTWLFQRNRNAPRAMPIDLGYHHFVPPPNTSALLRYPYCRFSPSGTCWYIGTVQDANDLFALYRMHGFPTVAVELAERYMRQFGALPPEEATTYNTVAVEQALTVWLG